MHEFGTYVASRAQRNWWLTKCLTSSSCTKSNTLLSKSINGVIEKLQNYPHLPIAQDLEVTCDAGAPHVFWQHKQHLQGLDPQPMLGTYAIFPPGGQWHVSCATPLSSAPCTAG